MVNVKKMEILLNERAMMPQNRAKRYIFCIRKGIFRKSLLQKGFPAQNRAQKGKRAIRARLVFTSSEFWSSDRLQTGYDASHPSLQVAQKKT